MLLVAFLFILGVSCAEFGGGVDVLYSGPKFLKEPPARVEFVNTKGSQVDCAATGNPLPVINWTLIDGSAVTNVHGLREVTKSGSLVFRSFRAEGFRPDVHSSVYRCVASNDAGVIHSRDVNVHGVVLQSHEVLVYDSYVIDGNTAVFKCHIPTVLKDYVTVTAWIKNDNLLIRPSYEEVKSGKFAVMPSGELHIRNVTVGESGSRFKCKTTHRLTGETQISSADGQLFVTESRGLIAPKIVESGGSVSVAVGQTAVLACAAQGNPAPHIKWYKKTSGNQLIEITYDGRIVKTDSAMVVKNSVALDSGIYRCESVSDLGKEVLDVKLAVTEPLSVKVVPSVRNSKLGERVVFECTTTGRISSTLWLHNGVPMKDVSGSSLVIESVDMSDRGMYQCFVRNESSHVMQSTCELTLSEISPQFVEVFDEIVVEPRTSVALKCSSLGIPLPTISWTIDGMPLNGSSKVLVASTVDRDGRAASTLKLISTVVEDGGVYSCIASSAAGRLVYSARVNVPGPLGSRIVPPVFAVSGHNVYLNCPVYGYPLASVTWEKDNRRLRPDIRILLPTNGTLIAYDVDKKTDAGIYKCYAGDKQGHRVDAKVEVVVMVAPKIVPFEFQDELLREGMRARLQCVVSDGELPITVSWLKDGMPLSPTLGVLVRVLDEYSSILTINSITPSHNGKYTCVASNRAATVIHSAELSVNVPPKVVPFTFQDEHLAEGQLARVSCIVSRGDLPLQLVWEKDGVEIASQSLGVQVKSFDEHSSILSITHVAPEHNGVYTCVASNGAGSARHSAQLIVNVPPQWIVEPEDTTVLKGNNAMIDCKVQGFPLPEVSWSKAADSTSSERFIKLYNGLNVHLYPNGSLLIRNINESDEGDYSCQASNGVGKGLSRTVQIKIHAPPVIKQGLSEQAVPVGKVAQLQCLVQGDSPLKITWHRNGKLVAEGQSRLKIEVTNTAVDSHSVLTISKVAREDSAAYECVAENAYGTNRSSSQLRVIEPPNAPQEFKVSIIESRQVELTWRASFDGNDKIKKYIVQYKLEADLWEEGKTMETVNGEPTNSVVSQLQPATSYIFRVFSENSQGRSPASQILHVTTDDDVPSGTPLNVQVEPVNVETFKVLWKAPEENLWNGKIQGYYVGYKETDTSEAYLFKTLMTRDPKANDLSVQLGGLKQFTKYSIAVLAYNKKGKGPQSEPVVVMTSEGAPTLAPTDVRCTTLTSQSIHVTWTSPNPNSINGILRGYKVAYKPTAEFFEDFSETINFTASNSVTLANLEKFMNYSITVLAATKAGVGPKSSVVYCKTLDDVPGPPVAIKALSTSENSVTVSWKPPVNPNGILKSYTVHWRSVNDDKSALSSTLTSQLHHYEIPRLQKGRQYEFWVTASTFVGEGQASKTVVQATSGPKTAAKIVSFEEKIVAAWKAYIQLPCEAVGIPEPQRKWHLKGNTIETTEKMKVSTNGTLTITDIYEENAGDYTCTVKNDIGEDKITYTVVVFSPPPVVSMKVSSIMSNAIEIEWIAPTNKMPRVKGYNLRVKREDGDWEEIKLGSEMRSYRIDSLDCGTKYELDISAYNKIGVSDVSETLTIFTNGSVPMSPSKSDLIEETSSSVSLYLNTWKNNGCPIHYFIVEYAPKSSNEWTLVSSSVKPEQRRLVIPNLKSGTWYGLRMTAHNSAGSSVAKYDFATLTTSGATISPEVLADAPFDRVDSLMAQLNFYLVVPIICTAVILLAILGVACMCVKLKQSDARHRAVTQRLSAAAAYELKRGDSVESFNYMQRGSMSRPSSTIKHAPGDITPYATLQLHHHNNHGQMSTLGRQCVAPPLPPPRFEGFPHDATQMMDPTFFPPAPNFVNGQMVETTFVFPSPMAESHSSGVNSIPPGYQNDLMK